MIMSYRKGFLHPKFVLLTGFFWVLFSKLMKTLFWVFTGTFIRYYSSKAMNSACCSDSERDSFESCEEDSELKSESFDSPCDSLSNESNQIDSEACDEEEPSKLVFKFEYQNWDCNLVEEEESKESCDFVERDDTISSSANKYQFFTGVSFSQFLDEPQVENLSVREFYVHSNGDDSPLKNQVTIDSKEGVNAEIVEPVAEKLPHEDDDFICSSIDSDSMNSMGEEGFLSEADFGTNIDYYTLGNHHVHEENAGLITDEEEDLDFLDDKDLENLDTGYEPDDFAEEDEDLMNELRKIEEECVKENSSGKNSEESLKHNNSDSLAAFDGEDSSRFDTLWEHQDLIEQLKMELKKVRATGLPTILEDSESPRIMEDLKPWNIDDKFHHCSNTNELPKFYKSYRERMRKFDILNYQKMYAIGFLQSKDPLESLSCHKKSSSHQSIKSILRRPQRKNKETTGDATNKFMKELYSDLEIVYVGQLCLSWEFLQWEYEKALELWETDQYGLRRFNEVAGEFQQFQVLIQRFIENEPFQGPRVENYTKNRCVMRNLLQVPLIREDKCSKDKKKQRQKGGGEDGADDEAIIITSDMLVEILEESIRTIWRFIRADKDASSFTLKLDARRETHQFMQLQDLSDSHLLLEILTDLHKKEKRLGELLRSGSCILKKLKKHDYDEDGSDQVLYFFSQVDMKLVWRVLNMSRITTDQLAWCRSKLNKITFVNRRIHVEPTFLLFPS